MLNDPHNCDLAAMKMATIIMIMLLFGCAETPRKTLKTSNDKIPVELLFELNGITVFRFFDAGEYRYFVDARGSTHSSYGGKVRHQDDIFTIK